MRKFVIAVLFLALSSGSAYAAPILWSDNGHYYDLIQERRTWTSALARAGQLTFDPDGAGGQAPIPGYLVTITSAQEQTFLNQQFGNGGLYWIAASDSANEGTWRWMAGPEAGSVLTYANWKPGEPNNGAGGFFQEDYAAGNWNAAGQWNDWLSFTSTKFVVEYGPAVATPEPASIGLLLTGLAGVALRRRRARAKVVCRT
ncbi:MAG TPA: C-type lectin domain-containing protein [Vicinamibacterales bacterium]|nr:C-type lectin domain-containing protein [Vicinamibacterales bacterium]